METEMTQLGAVSGSQSIDISSNVFTTSISNEDTESYAMVLDDLVLKSGANAILRGVSMAVRTGRFLGVLGESGAGKTTLLRFMARKLDEKYLVIEGRGVLPDEIWYIAQEDVLYEYDTPRRAVTFLHQMLYNSTTDEADIKANEYLSKVRFPESLFDKHIGSQDDGGLSVGARRLLNVALALCS
jgi:ABC-type multidrug transport system ATPase subunit